MSRSTAFLLALTLVLASLAAPAVAASAQTTATDGGTYEIGTELVFDVDDHDEEYTLRTAEDDLFVNAFQSENGTVSFDTDAVDPGTYVLIDQSSEEVVAEFTLVTEKTATSTPTATATESTQTATPTATESTPTPATTTDGPGFGPVAALIAVLGLVALGRDR